MRSAYQAARLQEGTTMEVTDIKTAADLGHPLQLTERGRGFPGLARARARLSQR